ncbi:MAG: hypothetical protein WA238_12160 [Methylocella sp.]
MLGEVEVSSQEAAAYPTRSGGPAGRLATVRLAVNYAERAGLWAASGGDVIRGTALDARAAPDLQGDAAAIAGHVLALANMSPSSLAVLWGVGGQYLVHDAMLVRVVAFAAVVKT